MRPDGGRDDGDEDDGDGEFAVCPIVCRRRRRRRLCSLNDFSSSSVYAIIAAAAAAAVARGVRRSIRRLGRHCCIANHVPPREARIPFCTGDATFQIDVTGATIGGICTRILSKFGLAVSMSYFDLKSY